MKKEDHSKLPNRKLKFAPKAPPPKIAKPSVPKTEPIEIKDATIDKALMDKLRTAKINPQNSKTRKNATQAQVSFGAINPTKPFNNSNFSYNDASSPKVEKEYIQPWDYNSNYPITLPLRPPYAGDPEILNEEEFGDIASTSLLTTKTQSNSACELGLTETREDSAMMFFQLPTVLPFSNNADSASSSRNSEKGCKLKDLSGGYLGKILVYKSGKVKMKLGDALFDVYPGSDCKFAQDVVAINLNEKGFCVIGQLGTRAVVTPDIDFMLDSLSNL